MSIKSEPYYWVVCDRCDARAEYDEYSAMQDPSQAVEGAEGAGWISINAKDSEMHYCDGCTVWSDDEDAFVPNFEPWTGSTKP